MKKNRQIRVNNILYVIGFNLIKKKGLDSRKATFLDCFFKVTILTWF